MKQSVQQRVTGALAALLALGLAACGGGDATVRGRVSDGAGTQAQGQVQAQGGLGGSGTVAAATQVRVSSVGQGGSLQLQGEAQVQAEGRYEVSVPADEERLVLQALDASGNVLASALLETSGEADGTATAPPMDSESSLEAEVFLQLVKDGVQADETDTVDLRARLDARIAQRARAGTAAQQAAWVKALAESLRAAQEARVKSLAEAGVSTSGSALFDAELAAAVKLNAALDASASTQAAYETFYAELAAAVQKVGAEAQEHAQSESSASAAFRVSLQARLPEQDAQPLVDAAVRAAASLEARSSGAAVSALLQAAGATDAVKAQAAQAAASLRAQVDSSGSRGAAANAFEAFSASIATNANLQATVLGAFLGVNGTTGADVGLAVTAASTASDVLDSTLDIAASGAVTTAGGVNATALATGTADAYASFASGLRNQVSVLSRYGAKSTPAMELLIVAEGSFAGSTAQ